MILHLEAAGVPISWTIVALYKRSYSIARLAVKACQEREAADIAAGLYRTADPMPSPHYLVEIDQVGDDWKIVRSDLMMSERYLKRQEHDERLDYLVQFQASPMPLGDAVEKAVAQALHSALVEFGYLVPRAEWVRRYPSRALVQEHYNAFSRAYDEHRRSGSDERMPFELRWAPYMEGPKDFVFPFDVAKDGDGWTVTKDGVPMPEMRSDTQDDVATKMRLLNSGYRPEDIPVLLGEEPVG